MLSVMALDAECCYADGHLWSVAFMLSVTSKVNMLSVVMLSVVMLNVVAPNTNNHNKLKARQVCLSETRKLTHSQ